MTSPFKINWKSKIKSEVSFMSLYLNGANFYMLPFAAWTLWSWCCVFTKDAIVRSCFETHLEIVVIKIPQFCMIYVRSSLMSKFIKCIPEISACVFLCSSVTLFNSKDYCNRWLLHWHNIMPSTTLKNWLLC